ncbi:MAG: hypothetical protein HOA41_03740, partial [Rhodospirillales bacterium]|nr:hypothetical protein [Rhodospirillales bacterium]
MTDRARQIIRTTLTAGVLAGLGLGLMAPSSARAAGDDYFAGKQIRYIIATTSGGGYDYYARLVTRHMRGYLKNMKFVVINRPGAGHVIGANLIYMAKPDGLTIGTFNTGLIYAQLIKRK